MAAKEWIVVTDSDELAVRVQVRHIHCFQGAAEGGTQIFLGGAAESKVVLYAQEEPDTIDELIGGELLE